jgi:AraC-like DNA-binding protein
MEYRANGESAPARVREFTAEDFRVPRAYLELLIGEAAAGELLGPTGGAIIPSRQFLNLCLDHMQRTADESLGTAPFRVACGAFGMMLAAAAQGDTFADGLQRFASASAVVRPDLTVSFSRSRRGLAMSYDYIGEREARRDLVTEIFAITVHCGFRWLTGRPLKPAGLRVAPPTGPLGPTLLKPVLAHAAQLGGTGVTVIYPLEDADAPLRAVKYQHWAAHELDEFTALLEETARIVAGAAPVAPGIVGRVRAVIGPEAWSETAAARALGMSTATLRRRLSEAGASFRGLSSEARRTAAQSLLATEQSLDEIAERLGFSDARSFRRACHAWFGMAPAEYRRQTR